MAQKVINAVSISIILIQFCSCVSLSKISIQVAIPSKYKISPDIKSVAVLNRSMNVDFINFRNDSAENVSQNLNSTTDYSDSTASDSAVVVAAKAIFESQRFDVVVPVQRNIWREDNLTKLPPLDSAFVGEICREFKIDALLVLESFSEKFSYRFVMPWRRAIGYIDLRYNSIWNLYSPSKFVPLLSISANDVLSWTGGLDNSNKEGFSQLPSIKEMLITGGIEAGLNIAGQICPSWVNETRYYYTTGDKNIDEAIPLLRMNKWEEAKEIWMKYAEVPSKSLRGRIEYNLALAAEMTGDFDSAVEWCGKSLKTKYSRDTAIYLKYLEVRRSTLEKAGL